jgi:hypothetical protein
MRSVQRNHRETLAAGGAPRGGIGNRSFILKAHHISSENKVKESAKSLRQEGPNKYLS